MEVVLLLAILLMQSRWLELWTAMWAVVMESPPFPRETVPIVANPSLDRWLLYYSSFRRFSLRSVTIVCMNRYTRSSILAVNVMNIVVGRHRSGQDVASRTLPLLWVWIWVGTSQFLRKVRSFCIISLSFSLPPLSIFHLSCVYYKFRCGLYKGSYLASNV